MFIWYKSDVNTQVENENASLGLYIARWVQICDITLSSGLRPGRFGWLKGSDRGVG
jgi:hypothetical protein